MTNAVKCIIHVVLLLVVLPLQARATETKTPATRTLDSSQIEQAITELSKLIRTNYAIAEKGEKAALWLEKNLAAGLYAQITDAHTLVERITREIQAITGDKHFRFGLEPLPVVQEGTPTASKPVDAETERALQLARIKRENYGFNKVEILAGNVGYLDFRRFQSPEIACETLVGALAFLANVEAIIIDLRYCHGGNAYMNGYLAGYFFPRVTHLYDIQFRGSSYSEHFFTAAYLPGKRLPDIPMYILTSAYTFSGAEAFAYRFQVLKRAIIVGETTGGGANAGGVLSVAPFFLVFMPMGCPIDRNTGTNWEGTGVIPDIKSTALDARYIAHLEALKTLKTKTTLKEDLTRLDWAIEKTKATHSPISLNTKELQRLCGNYGDARVYSEGEQLRFVFAERSPFLLTPLSSTVFMAEAQEWVRLEFFPNVSGRIERLIFTDEDGNSQELFRQKIK